MRRFHLAALSLALSVSLTACSDDKDDDKGRSDSTPSASQTASDPASSPASDTSEQGVPEQDVVADQEIVDDAVLTIDDMPPGWQAEAPDDDDDDDESGDQELADCMRIDVEELNDDDNVSAESDEFTSPDDAQISSEVSLAADEESSTKSFELAGRPEFRDCMAAELEEELADDDEVEVGDITIDEVSFEQLGDETVAFRVNLPMSLQGMNFNASMDFVMVRVGRGSVLLSGLGIGSPLDSDELAGYAEICVERLRTGLDAA